MYNSNNEFKIKLNSLHDERREIRRQLISAGYRCSLLINLADRKFPEGHEPQGIQDLYMAFIFASDLIAQLRKDWKEFEKANLSPERKLTKIKNHFSRHGLQLVG